MSKKITFLISFVLSVSFVSAQDVFMKKANTQNQQNKDFVFEKKVSDPLRAEKLVPGPITPSLCSQKGRAALNEGFEDAVFPPKKWTVINGGDDKTWTRTTSKFHSGTACATIVFSTTAHDDYLVTPMLKITSENKVLTAWFANRSTYPEPYDVMVSTTVNDDPAAFTLLKAEDSPGNDWEQRSYDLSAYVGQNIYVAFRSTTTDQWQLYIDDVVGPEIYLPENDVEASKLYLASKIKPGITNLKAKVENIGSLAQTFDAILKIFDATNAEVYSDTVNVTNLVSEQDSILVFNTWDAVIGAYTAKFYLSNNAADTNYLNDSIIRNFEVKDILAAYTINAAKSTYNFIDLATGDETEEGADVAITSFPMSEEYSPVGIYRLYDNKTIGLVALDGQCEIIGTITGVPAKFSLLGLAYDWKNDIWYASGIDTISKFHLYSIDMSTFVATEVGTGGTANAVIIDIDMAWDGMLYGPSLSDDILYKIDPATGVISEVGTIGLNLNYGQGVSFDGHEGKLYTVTTLASGTGNYKFGYYDLYSGAFVEIKDMGNQEQHATIVVTKIPKPAYSAVFTVKEDTNLIAGATMVINNTKLISDSSGNAVFYGADGTYHYTVSKFGYEDLTDSIIIAGANITDTINLTKLPAFDVTFNIKDAQSAPLDAAVTVYFGTNIIYNGTAANGTISFNEVPIGNYTYDVVLDGYTSILSVAFTVGADTTIDVEMVEILDAPYGLNATYTGTTTADFSWNNAIGFTDDFESYEDFSLTFDPWVLKDVDGLETYGFQGFSFPNSGFPMAGIIFNPAAVSDQLAPAHSGEKYVAVFNPSDGSPCNDWIIAPKTLIVNGAKVSFWARGGNVNYSEEKFQVFVSTTNTEVSSFVALSPVVTCPANSVEWKQYSYDLSAYANKEVYVAIHVTSVDQFYFCLDDFKIGQAKSQSKAFVGYNVFVDGTKVASEITEKNYDLTDLVLGTTYELGVQSVYTTGVSSIVTINYLHDNAAVNDLDQNNIELYPNPSNGTFFINVNGSYNVEVFDVTGKVVKSQIINNKGVVSLDNQGLYIVKFSNENETLIKKVIVK